MGWRVWNHLIYFGMVRLKKNRACLGAGELIWRYSDPGEGTLTLLRGIGRDFTRLEHRSCTKLDSSCFESSRQAPGARQRLGFEPLFKGVFTDS
jgi:hypothetical protein